MTARKQWMALGGGPCKTCDALDGIEIDEDDTFPGGLDGPPAHPNCMCSLLTIEDPDSPYAQYTIKRDSMTRTDGRYRMDSAGRDEHHADGCTSGGTHGDARTARAPKSKLPKLAPPIKSDDLLALARQISDAMQRRDYAAIPLLDSDQHGAMVDLLAYHERWTDAHRKRFARDLSSDVWCSERLLQIYSAAPTARKVKTDMARPPIKTPTRDDEAEALRRMEEDSHRRWQESTLGVLHDDDEQHDDEDLTPEQRARAAMDRAAAARNAGKSHVHRRDR